MKKIFITLLLAALLVILISCHDKDPSAVPPSSTSLTSASTAITTLPELDMNALLEKVINTHGASRTAEVLDDVKAIGYKYSTRAAMTVSITTSIYAAGETETTEHIQQL